MPKEVLLYGPIYSETSALFINAVNEVEGEELVVRINCEGGSPEYGWGMINKFKEFAGKKSVMVDGQAYSMGTYFLAYAEKGSVTGTDVSQYLIHRAAYSQWFEQSPEYFTDAIKQNLVQINKSLQAALEARIDVEAFENLKQVKDKNIKFKDIFSLESRIDVFLNAADAKKIGLIDKVIKLTPQKAAEMNAYSERVAAKFIVSPTAEIENTSTQNQKPKNKMTIDQLKAEHPDLFAQVVALGVSQEKDRVEACLAFIDVDAAGVKAAIESGKPLSQKQMAELSLKAVSKNTLEALKGENAGAVKTSEEAIAEKSAKEKEITDAENDIRAELGLKIKQ